MTKKSFCEDTVFTQKHIILFVCLTSLIVRLIFWQEAIASALTHFHLVPGLDMETLLKMSEWGNGRTFPPVIVWPRIVNFLIWNVNNYSHNVLLLFLIHSIAGTILAVGVSNCSLILTGNKLMGLAAGITSACYGPLVFYEFTTLQESLNTFAIFIIFWSWLHFVTRSHNVWSAILFGLLMATGSIGRPVAILPVILLCTINFYLLKKKSITATNNYVLLCSIIATWLLIAIINLFLNGNFSPWYSAKHVFISATYSTSLLNHSFLGNTFSKFHQYIKNFLMLFAFYEIPENLNYHFFISYLPVLRFLLGPAWLIIGVFFSLFNIIKNGKNKPALIGIMFFIFGLGISLSVRLPVSRYRLMMIPFFILISWYGYYLFLRQYSNKKIITSIIIIFSFVIIIPGWQLSRLDDSFAYAIAEKQKFGYIKQQTLLQVFQSWQQSGKFKYLLLCVEENFSQGDYTAAKNFLQCAKAKDKNNTDLILYLFAVIAYEEKDFPTLQKYLNQIGNADNLKEFKAKYFLFNGELLRYQKNYATAETMYKKSLELADNDPDLIEYVTNVLKSMTTQKSH